MRERSDDGSYVGAKHVGVVDLPQGTLAEAVATVEGGLDGILHAGPGRGQEQLVALLDELDGVGLAAVAECRPHAGEIAGGVGLETGSSVGESAVGGAGGAGHGQAAGESEEGRDEGGRGEHVGAVWSSV